MEATPRPSRKPVKQSRIFYGWWVLLASALLGSLGAGLTISGFPVFFIPIQRELNLSSTAMSLVLGLAWAQSGIVAPAVGWLADRYGTRRLVVAGGVTCAVALMLVSVSQRWWHLLVLYGVLVGLGRTAAISPTLMATVNQWFVRRKAVALAILTTSFTAGSAILVRLLAAGNANLGWRTTSLYSGLVLGFMTLPASLIIRSHPEDMGLLPDGDQRKPETGSQGTVPASEGELPGLTVKQALSTSSFWLLLIGLALRVSVADAIVIHQIPMMVWKGVGEQQAAFFLSLSFGLMIPLRLGLGVAGGYLPPRLVLFVAMSVGAAGSLAFLMLDGLSGVLPLVVGLAVIEGVSAVNWIAVGDYFGRRSFGTLVGIMTLFHSAGGLIAPVASGWIFDQTQSYAVVLMCFIPMLSAAGVVFGLAKKPLLSEPASASLPEPA